MKSEKVVMQCKDCGHKQTMLAWPSPDGSYCMGSGANWCDACFSGKPEPLYTPEQTMRVAVGFLQRAKGYLEQADELLAMLYRPFILRIEASDLPGLDALESELVNWPDGFYRSELRTALFKKRQEFLQKALAKD